MILRKSLAIGVIALFIGLVFTPMSGATVKETETMIPVELSVMNADGTIGTTMIEFSQKTLDDLLDLLENLKNIQDKDTILERLSDLFDDHHTRGLNSVINFELLEKIPGSIVLSYGKGRGFLTRYHGRIMAKKLISAWNYPTGLGATVIWGNGITHEPTQVLLKRQVGLMVGFVGLYVYIPPLLEGMGSSTFFVGSALFAHGVSL